MSLQDRFFCPGYRLVADRRIHCARTQGHGSETFVEGFLNSCNANNISSFANRKRNSLQANKCARTGVDGLYDYMEKMGLMEKTGVDLPGEAGSIMHDKENVGEVELATISFGQSFQITPLQLLRAVSAILNGGTLVTPHIGMYTADAEGHKKEIFEYPVREKVLSPETCDTLREMMTLVVSEGGGSKGAVAGYQVGGKTATSQKLPRSAGKYISSFMAFAPADDPKIVGIFLIDEPTGTYYGGTIAAPAMAKIYDMVLPYLFPEERETAEETENMG